MKLSLLFFAIQGTVVLAIPSLPYELTQRILNIRDQLDIQNRLNNIDQQKKYQKERLRDISKLQEHNSEHVENEHLLGHWEHADADWYEDLEDEKQDAEYNFRDRVEGYRYDKKQAKKQIKQLARERRHLLSFKNQPASSPEYTSYYPDNDVNLLRVTGEKQEKEKKLGPLQHPPTSADLANKQHFPPLKPISKLKTFRN